MLLSEWALLGFAGWTVALLVSTVGVTRVGAVLRKEAKANSFNPSVPHGTELYQRCMRAHLNCTENLPIFASLVLIGAHVGVPGSLFQLSAFAVLVARMLQTIAHIASGRNRAVLVRFTFFTVQLVCFVIMGVLLVMHGMLDRVG